MSFRDILFDQPNTWANLYVNSINSETSGDNSTIPVFWSGCWLSGITGNVFVAKQGSIVSLNVANVSGTGTSSNFISCPVGTLGDFAPTSNKVFPYQVVSGGTASIGLLEVYADGHMSLFASPAGGVFNNSGINSFPVGSVSYNLVG